MWLLDLLDLFKGEEEEYPTVSMEDILRELKDKTNTELMLLCHHHNAAMALAPMASNAREWLMGREWQIASMAQGEIWSRVIDAERKQMRRDKVMKLPTKRRERRDEN